MPKYNFVYVIITTIYMHSPSSFVYVYEYERAISFKFLSLCHLSLGHLPGGRYYCSSKPARRCPPSSTLAPSSTPATPHLLLVVPV